MCITKVKTSSREEWLKLRGQYIGGSDAAAALLAVLGYIF